METGGDVVVEKAGPRGCRVYIVIKTTKRSAEDASIDKSEMTKGLEIRIEHEGVRNCRQEEEEVEGKGAMRRSNREKKEKAALLRSSAEMLNKRQLGVGSANNNRGKIGKNARDIQGILERIVGVVEIMLCFITAVKWWGGWSSNENNDDKAEATSLDRHLSPSP
ncbi:hypothetical protein C8R42DRAFT_648978 [Lentinula raphanica]|nr:hypothetical protein C8R42DRAFT_648978 [Lentinula raphanica]